MSRQEQLNRYLWKSKQKEYKKLSICPYCNSKKIIKRGVRKTKNRGYIRDNKMVDANQILKKEVGLFIENNIDSYRSNSNKIKFINMMKKFFDNDGFFVLCKSDGEVEGYIDTVNLPEITKLIDNNEKIFDKKISDIDQKIFNKYLVNRTESVKSVLEELHKSNQTFFPVVNSQNQLIGRVSIKILKEKIDKIYGDLGIKFH